MTSLTTKILTGATVLVAVLLIALTVAVYTVIPQAIQEAAQEPVTIANPVDEVRVTNIVETAAPRDASLYGYCFRNESGSYEILVTAFSGGIQHLAASGSYRDGETVSQKAQEIADYYYGYRSSLDFGIASEECSHLEGWSSQ